MTFLNMAYFINTTSFKHAFKKQKNKPSGKNPNVGRFEKHRDELARAYFHALSFFPYHSLQENQLFNISLQVIIEMQN